MAHRRPRALLALLATLLLAQLALFGAAAPARAADKLTSHASSVTVGQDGSLQVRSVLTFDGAPPNSIEQAFALREEIVNQREYVYRVSELRATAGGRDVGQVRTEGDREIITITPGGANEVEVSYRVAGASVTTPGGGTLVRWNVLQGLSVPVDQVTAEFAMPAQFSDFKCVAGPPGTEASCALADGTSASGIAPRISDGPRGAGEIVGVRIAFPAGAVASDEQVDDQWTLGRAFTGTGVPLAVALGLLALGALALFLLHRRAGRDANPSGDPIRVAEFVPVGAGVVEFKAGGEVLPGQIGTVADERVDPIDVTATIIDLAVRGHLLIVELPRRSEFAPTDWTFHRMPGDESRLQPYEKALLDALAPADGSSVQVSEIGPSISGVIPTVQNDLYDDMVDNGWYDRRPDSTRNVWNQAALILLIVGVVLTGVLAAFTTFGLTGLAVVALGLGLAFVAQEMPARTALGARLLAGLGVLRQELRSEPTDRMPKGQEYRELSEVLPYAIVLGGADRWLDAIVAADDDDAPDPTDLSWYHGPDNWHLRDLPDSLRNFITTVSGNLFAR
ncbi:hypothetical protein BI335_20090 [Enemella evansiae]|uniref:DUF2207 domain-containing protein n=1 Tax=Enemella evansiae TaxID=2016499 RepID=UPI000B968113|nr:DUF2207 domain-containing protein [Enemella evansiae]OYO07675.1 hypothetical protein BI335_20090 [Enemella evansiae]